ncbi:hypothetical protein, partial [Neoaquamicrobium sediminum]|uniref:hypothetical protein n=1 Tax=Neoaquamicrobium sediminum TaxID=1849104 RepID=UPI00360F7E93
RTSHGRVTQKKRPPANPGRFKRISLPCAWWDVSKVSTGIETPLEHTFLQLPKDIVAFDNQSYL